MQKENLICPNCTSPGIPYDKEAKVLKCSSCVAEYDVVMKDGNMMMVRTIQSMLKGMKPFLPKGAQRRLSKPSRYQRETGGLPGASLHPPQ